MLGTERGKDCVGELGDIGVIIGIKGGSRGRFCNVFWNLGKIVGVMIGKNVKIMKDGKGFNGVLMIE